MPLHILVMMEPRFHGLTMLYVYRNKLIDNLVTGTVQYYNYDYVSYDNKPRSVCSGMHCYNITHTTFIASCSLSGIAVPLRHNYDEPVLVGYSADLDTLLANVKVYTLKPFYMKRMVLNTRAIMIIFLMNFIRFFSCNNVAIL
jgi:hypothetical protein